MSNKNNVSNLILTADQQQEVNYLHFGLNQNVVINKIELSTEKRSMNFELMLKDQPDSKRTFFMYYPAEDASEGSQKAWVANMLHILHAMIGDDKKYEQIKQEIAKKAGNTIESAAKVFYQAFIKLIKGKTFDIFLQYSLPKDGKQYLRIPTSPYDGTWITQHIEGEFEEVRDEKGLHYKDKNTGELHKIYVKAKSLEKENFKRVEVDKPQSSEVEIVAANDNSPEEVDLSSLL